MSSPPDSRYRFTTATLSWARDEHATLGEWSARRADPHRVRAALLTRWLGALRDRLTP
ncbi:hypothetical protein [Halorussus amylolyticus]|uniref:hypothetical protein n=1 Tax=Halorussus amylolyticus TaxID=1126242 RepID=UPI00138EE1D3|nr:hypothetical protein [Halorussus amylolyticus]